MSRSGPRRRPIRGHRGRDVVDEIRLRTREIDGRAEQLSGGDLQVRRQTLGARAALFKLPPFDLSRFHRLGRMLTFQGLDAGHLIDAHGVLALLIALGCLLIAITHLLHLLGKHLRIVGLGVEPIAALMGFEIARLLKNAPLVGARSTAQSRAGPLRRPTATLSSA